MLRGCCGRLKSSYLVAAAIFRSIERGIGILYELLITGRIRKKFGDTNADGYGNGLVPEGHGMACYALAQTFGQNDGTIKLCVWKKDCEFFTTVTTQRIGFANAA